MLWRIDDNQCTVEYDTIARLDLEQTLVNTISLLSKQISFYIMKFSNKFDHSGTFVST